MSYGSPSWEHVLAVVAGAARPDGDVTAHFGSIMGFDNHALPAVELGLIEPAPGYPHDDGPEYRITRAGREFAEQFQLSEVPAGRANAWHGYPVIVRATEELSRRWVELNGNGAA